MYLEESNYGFSQHGGTSLYSQPWGSDAGRLLKFQGNPKLFLNSFMIKFRSQVDVF